MGMFDSVKVKCPDCGEVYLAQSKGGDCVLAYYDMPGEGPNPAPTDVMCDVNRHAPFVCGECGTEFQVEEITMPTYRAAKITSQ